MLEKMPLIVSCTGSDCAYNRDLTCNAMAVTMGADRQAVCDTFYRSDHQVAHPDSVSFVGACKMEGCRFNRNLECTAFSGVSLVGDNGRVRCHTYEARAAGAALG